MENYDFNQLVFELLFHDCKKNYLERGRNICFGKVTTVEYIVY